MFGMGPWELAVVLVIVLIIFGAGRLPEIGGGIGKAIQNFKKATREAELEEKSEEKKIEEKTS